MPLRVNLRQVFDNITLFWQSGVSNGVITVQINFPFRETVDYKMERMSTLPETFRKVCSGISSYLENTGRITSSQGQMYYNNATSKKLIIEHIKSHDFAKHLAKHNLSGTYTPQLT